MATWFVLGFNFNVNTLSDWFCVHSVTTPSSTYLPVPLHCSTEVRRIKNAWWEGEGAGQRVMIEVIISENDYNDG